MNEFINKYKEKLLTFWHSLDKKQQYKLIGTIIFLIASLSIFTFFAAKPKYEIAFSNLNPKDAGIIVNRLEEMGIKYQLTAGGKNIAVPESMVSKVIVTLAQDESIGSGNIYTKFWDNASFGMTESQFQVLERGAIEEELKQLIVHGIEGINDAYVMITLPEEKVFYSEEQQQATASVIVNIEPGTQLTPVQIKSIYHIISKSIPNLPVENITLSDQYGEPLEYTAQNTGLDVASYNQQRQIEKEFQQEIKKEIQTMLSRIMGRDRVSVTVFAKMNFDQKRTVSNLVEPVVDGKGIARSVEQIQESFTGEQNAQGGVPGTGDAQIPTYPSGTGNNGDYEHIEERINYEVNEITKEVISSPYRLEDLSITVVVDLLEDNDPNSETGQTKQAVRDLIKPIVLAATSQEESLETDLNMNADQKIAVIAHEFQDQTSVFENQNQINPLFLYGAIGLSVLAIGGVGYTLIRRRRNQQIVDENEEKNETIVPEFDFTPMITEEAALQQEIHKMSKQKPDEFIKLLRTWLSEE